MVKLYVDLILQDKWSLDRVPYIWKDQVAAQLEEIKRGE